MTITPGGRTSRAVRAFAIGIMLTGPLSRAVRAFVIGATEGISAPRR